MRAIKKEISNNNLLYIMIIIFIIIILSLYVVVWKEAKNRIINILKINNSKYEFNYKKIKVGGFPLVMKSVVNDLEVKILYNSDNYASINFDKITIKNILFTKKFDVSVDGKIVITNNKNRKYNTIELKYHSIEFSLNNNDINNIDTYIKNVIVKSYDDNDKVVLTNDFNNFIFKLITVNDVDYQNKTVRFNIDEIRTTVNNEKDNNVKLESNFEVIFSNIKEYKNDSVISISNKINTFLFNDISNNYSISIDGIYDMNLYTRSIILDLNANISNYNYLISAVNDDNKYFLIDKNTVSNWVQILQLIPASEKDTSVNKHYSIKSNLINLKFYINNVDINTIIQKLIFKDGIN